MGMPKKISDKGEPTFLLRNDGRYILNEGIEEPPATYQAATSFVLGGQVGYNSVNGGKIGFSVVTGLSYPLSNRLYALSINEMTEADGNKSYGIGGGFMLYLHPPGTTWLNLAIMSRVGTVWEPDAEGDIMGSYLSGVGGMVLTFPFDEFWGGWISFEAKKDVKVTEYRAVFGIVSFL
jgi:hypothetical protein